MTTQAPTPTHHTARASATTRMGLAGVVRGKQKKPKRVVLYGPEKIGKSTFAADAPKAIFLGAEDGTSEIDVARFAEPTTLGDVYEAIRTLTDDPHDYETLVVDTLDWLEPMLWKVVCDKGDEKGQKKPNIEAFGYGKGYVAALDEWRIFLSRLDALRAKRGMNIILLAHAHVKPYKNPDGDDYDRFEMKVHAKAGGLIREWADAVLFANYEIFTKTKGDGLTKRAHGVSNGARVIFTTRRASADAGNRYGLPAQLPLSWEAFNDAVVKGAPQDPAKLRAAIDAMLPAVSAEDRAKAEAWLAVPANGRDALKLSQLADKLRGRMLIENAESKEDAQ
jgi:hypothetical protein